MKIMLIAGSSTIHTVRWANGLSAAGHEVHVISQHPEIEPFDPAVKVHLLPFRGVAGYFLMVPAVRRILSRIQPDIVNAHYASGYGTTARLAAVHPVVLSVWGSDVYDFPYKSPVHRWLVRKNLEAADTVASTSACMARQTRTIAPRLTDIPITPFGVDMDAYGQVQPPHAGSEAVVIGTVKTMARKYGIDTLIRAFALLHNKLVTGSPRPASHLQLRLVGGGPQTAELKRLAERLHIADKVDFVGRVPHSQVPQQLSQLDVYVALSRLDSESFGVAIIEAGAAQRPVVVSDAGGLPEVTIDGVTGLVVPRENPQAAADAIERLVLDADLRRRMGKAGRKHVQENYSWDVCIQTMLKVYEETIERYQATSRHD